MKTSILIFTLAVSAFVAIADNDRDRFDRDYGPKHGSKKSLNAVRRWNQIANDASALDHTAPAAGETRVFREQFGPGRAARALAIASIAIFDAINAEEGKYDSYTDIRAPKGPFSVEAAIAQAAHDTLNSLFPAQAAGFDAFLAEDLARISNRKEKANGILLGKRAAAAILADRADDGAPLTDPFVGADWLTSDLPGHWRMDPVSQIPLALGAHWSECAPFVVRSAHQFRAPPPPLMGSPTYAAAFDEVKRLGSVTSTERTPAQTVIGIYWGYDGTPGLCAPPRLYNQIALQIAQQQGSDAIDTARLLALGNIAMSDATLTVWESKYYYDFWRPVTGIREANPGSGPSGLGDGNAATIGDPNWSPLGAPASNIQSGKNFTPPFPAYPSGHAGMGAAMFQTLRRIYGTDRIRFTFVSDEFDGVTRDADGSVRPLIPLTFRNLSQAEEENGQSRIYLGIHWSFDKTESIVLGRKVGDYVFKHSLNPRKNHFGGHDNDRRDDDRRDNDHHDNDHHDNDDDGKDRDGKDRR